MNFRGMTATERLIRNCSVVALAGILASVVDAWGVTSCKVTVDRTGELLVSAKGIVGSLRHDANGDGAFEPFTNDMECVEGDTARKCRIAALGTLAAKTPPRDCSLVLQDSSGSFTCPHFGGCVVGLREGATGPAGPEGPAGPLGPRGPEGPQGTPGVSGWVMVVQDCTNAIYCQTWCPFGTKVIGGGCLSASWSNYFWYNAPGADGSGWVCGHRQDQPISMTARSICAQVN